jgi:F0F1-type ATP synthase assembly protein I
MAEDKIILGKSAKDFATGMAVYSSASVLGPLLVIGGIGYFLDKSYHGNHLILLGSIFIAFIVTNILIFRKTFAIMAEFKNFKGNGKNGYDEDDEDEENDKFLKK